MTDEKKKEFTRRLTQCNASEMIVIQYDIFFAYLDDACASFELGGEPFKSAISHGDAVLERLQGSLNFKYDLANQLYPLYNYCRRQLALARATHKKKPLSNARNVMNRLYEAFAQIAEEDQSQPVMQNTQVVYAGYTYGRHALNEAMVDNVDIATASRGFLA
jgi:flagellar protein FliS